MEPCIAKVFLSTTNEMQRYTLFFIVVSALHVSSGFSAHHQELKYRICNIATCQTCVLLPLAWLSRNAEARYRAVKIQPQWVVTPGKQTNSSGL
jgi:hypothetical protein